MVNRLLLDVIPRFIVAFTIYNLISGFAEYTDSLLKDIPSRNPPVNVLS